MDGTDRARPWKRFALLLLLTLAVRAPSFARPIMDIDEAEYASISCRMLDGGMPYRDGVEIKFPGTLYVYYATFAIFGRYNMLAVHLVCAGFAFATALAARRIALRLAGERAGWWAAGLYAVFSVGFYSKMQAANTEMFAVLPASLAVLCFLEERAVAAGFLAGVAILFKQPVALLPAGLAAGALVEAVARRQRVGPALGVGLRLAAGAVLALGAAAAYFLARGILDDVVFWTWTYIWRYYFPAVQDSVILRLLGDPVPFTFALAPAVVLAAGARGPRLGPVVAWLASMFAAGFVGGRMYGHYFLLTVPPLCVLAGVGAARLFPDASARPRARRALLVVTGLLAAGQLVGASLYEGATDSLWSPRPDYRAAAARVEAGTAPSDRVFVWGWFPALYVASDRCPSTRFVYAHHLAGHAANEQGKRGHSVQRGWVELMDDLRREPPRYVLDTSHGDYEFRYAPMESFPELWGFVSASYVQEGEIAGVRLYRRSH